MVIPDEMQKQIKCCLNSQDHIVFEPKLINCGGNACSKCIENLTLTRVKCYYCKNEHEKDELQQMPLNLAIGEMIQKRFLKELVINLNTSLKKMSDTIKGNFTKFQTSIVLYSSKLDHFLTRDPKRRHRRCPKQY
jgi:hypothetical protein